MQREIFIPYDLPALQWVDNETVKSWKTWREAVIWCWENRPNATQDEIGDQTTFRLFAFKFYEKKMHAPHISRWFNKKTKAPMDMPQDLAHSLEGFTGWRGVSQWLAMQGQQTLMEQVIQERSVA